MKENIEVEIRSFINKEQYKELLDFFQKNAVQIKEDYQETYYFDCDKDLRIQKNDSYAKIWMKDGLIHDEARKELEIKFDREDFEKLEDLLVSIAGKVKIKWYRKRFEFKWDDIIVDLDYTKGYGYILELEKLTTAAEKDEALKMLKNKLAELNISQTPREVFEEKYKEYALNWQKMVALDSD